MNAMLFSNLPDALIAGMAWTLIHAIWQGLIIAALLLVALRALRGASAPARYTASCAALLALVIGCMVTFCVTCAVTVVDIHPVAAHTTGFQSVTVSAPLAPSLAPSPPARFNERDIFRWIVISWFIGVLALTLRHLIGWFLLQRLRRAETCTRFEPDLRALKERLRISRPIALLQTTRIDVPAVIGAFKPIILVPLGVLNDLSPRQVEAILAHELAHIRRHDYLVNLLQTAVETLLFYHPAVWWMSHRIRVERENCCDDIAAVACGDACDYASALAELEARRGPTLAIAATGADLLSRVRRLLQLPTAPHPRRWSLAAAVLVLSCIALPLALIAQNRGTQPASAAAATAPTDGKLYIKIAIRKDSIFVDGQPTDWTAVKKKLDAIPESQRRQTVLEVAAASPEVTVRQFFNGANYASHLVDIYGLAYVSQTGIVPTTQPAAQVSDDARTAEIQKLRLRLLQAQKEMVEYTRKYDKYALEPDVSKRDTSEARIALAQRDAVTAQVAQLKHDLARLESGGAIEPPAPRSRPSTEAAIALRGDEFFINGPVARPGAYTAPASQPLNVKQAIAAAGGVSPNTPEITVTVIRRDGQRETTAMDNAALDALLAGKVTDITIRAGDIVQVTGPPVGEYYIDGHVKRTGVYSLSGRRITVKQALVAAGGLEDAADGFVTVLRRSKDASGYVMTNARYTQVLAGEQGDLYMEPNDIVRVTPQPFKVPGTQPATQRATLQKFDRQAIERITDDDPTARDMLNTLAAMEFNLARLRRSLGENNRAVINAKEDVALQQRRLLDYANAHVRHAATNPN